MGISPLPFGRLLPKRMKLKLLLSFSLMMAAAWGQNVPARSSGDSSDPPAATDESVSTPLPSGSPGPSYQIGPNDMLRIAVWKEPDLTATVPVRSDGMISVPLLDDVFATGLTPMELSALLAEKLKKYVAAPRVTVMVTQTNSHRIYVIGEVAHGGPMPLLHDLTVLQALATAGLSQFANMKRIYILRTENGQTQKIPFNYKQVIKGEAMSQNILLKAEDTIVVP
jgi:polysaccharide biosynthesis/export protein